MDVKIPVRGTCWCFVREGFCCWPSSTAGNDDAHQNLPAYPPFILTTMTNPSVIVDLVMCEEYEWFDEFGRPVGWETGLVGLGEAFHAPP